MYRKTAKSKNHVVTLVESKPNQYLIYWTKNGLEQHSVKVANKCCVIRFNGLQYAKQALNKGWLYNSTMTHATMPIGNRRVKAFSDTANVVRGLLRDLLQQKHYI